MTTVAAARRMQRRRRTRGLVLDLLTWAAVLIGLVPAVWVVLTAFRSNIEINASPAVWIPREITFDAFAALFGIGDVGGTVPYQAYLRNSLIASILSTVVAVSLGTLAAYAFAQFRFRGRGGLFLGIMLSRAVPGIALGLPLFILFARLGWLDQPHTLALAYVALNIPFTVWLMDVFFGDIPTDLGDAAAVDGATAWQAFWKVYLPLARPGLGAASIFAFLAAWNEYQLAVVVTRTTASRTFPVGLFDYTQQFTFDWRGMCAMSVVMMIPAVLFVLAVQRNLLRGLTFGATKG
jgi:multiple sugar transport system permease protein